MTIKLTQDGNINFIQTGSTTASNSIADIRITNNNTAGTTFLTINTSGNIGISTTTPATRLHVNSSSETILRISGASSSQLGINIFDTASRWSMYKPENSTDLRFYDGGADRIIFSNGGTVVIRKDLGTSIPGNTEHATQLILRRSSDAKSMVIGVLDNGSSMIQCNESGVGYYNLLLNPVSGNIGIGTTSPTYKLQVNGSAHFTNSSGHSFYFLKSGNPDNIPGMLVQQRGDNSWGICSEFRTIDSGNDRPSIMFSSYAASTNWSVGYCYTDDHFRISTNHGHRNNGWGTERFRINSNGTLHFFNNTHHYGKIIVQNGQDGGTSRGIYMWTDTDTNWGIYMGQSGGGRSLSGGTACTGVYDFNSYATRFRVHNSSSNGWIFENSSEEHLMSIRGDDGHVHIAGNVGIGIISPGWKLDVNGGITSREWFRVVGGGGVYWENYGRGIQSADSAGAIYGNVSTVGGGMNSWIGYDISGRYTFMANGDTVGIHDRNHSWVFSANNANMTIYRTVTLNANLNFQGYANFYQTGSVSPSSGGTINWVRMGRIVALEIVNVPCNQVNNDGDSIQSNLPSGIRPIQTTHLLFYHMHAWNGDHQQTWHLRTDGTIWFHYQSATDGVRKNGNVNLSCSVSYMCQATTSQ
jgi:hypothetical protein